jgi:3-phenylpropionate/cinnamic acid dioxygenase small subunit
LAREVAELLGEYVAVIDEDRLAQWPELFIAEGRYRVLSRENVALGLPAPLVYYYSQGMLRDRVTALRDALNYQFVDTRHITSPSRISRRGDGDLDVKSNFVIYQTTEAGVTKVFVVGQYEDIVTRSDRRLLFRQRDVILDTFGILNNIAVPL